jgi:aspartate-semialdehyde dehydrogenase
MMRLLEERDFPVDSLVPVASARSVGRELDFKGGRLEVRGLTPEVFDGVDIAIFDVPDEVSARWVPVAAERGAVVIDKSAAFRMDPDVPLVVPEINPHEAGDPPKGIIANANCTTLAIVLPLWALHRRWGLRRLVLASYQAASGAGRPGIDDLWDQTQRAAKEEDAVTAGGARGVLAPGAAFPHPIALNFIPQCGSVKEDGYTSEELKLCNESRKILGIPDLRVTATCVRVPVVIGHGVAVHAEFEEPVDAAAARELLGEADGVVVRDDVDNAIYPTALEAAGTDPCYVGRIRADRFDERALEMFCVADNLRKGAALNAVQIAELRVRAVP